MNRIKKCICLIIIIFMVSNSVSAETYWGYQYNEWDESEPAPNGYEPEQIVNGESLGIGKLENPKDMVVLNNELYILDSGNKRVVVLDQKYQLVRIIDQFVDNKVPYSLNAPQGLYVTEQGGLIIADTENKAVIICDKNGVILDKITKPESEVFPQTSEFKPMKVLQDQVGNYYVIVSGLFYGSAVFNTDGEFNGFFGSNKVQLTAQILADFIWKRFLTAEQIAKSERNVPIGYSSFDIDEENFIYTCTDRIRNGSNEIRKLNPVGNNILPDNEFGDREYLLYKSDLVDTSFVDLCVDDNGFIYGLDITRGRIFQYDREGNTITIFGGKGEQFGTFTTPQAIECMGKDVLVLDNTKNSITVFRPTEFGNRVRTALQLYNEGLYDEAQSPWEDVLAMYANFDFAYISIGKSLYNLGEYKEAMEYFRLGNDRTNESKAFKEYRTEWARDRFGFIMTIIMILVLFVIYRVNRKKMWKYINRYKNCR